MQDVLAPIRKWRSQRTAAAHLALRSREGSGSPPSSVQVCDSWSNAVTWSVNAAVEGGRPDLALELAQQRRRDVADRV